MLLDQVAQVNARNFGEFCAQEDVGTEIINAGNQPLKRKLRYIRGQRELIRYFAQFRLSKKWQKRH